MFKRLSVLFALLSPAAYGADGDAFAGIVSSASPEATAAGVRILESGGNAVDAAVAVSLALAVSEPAGSGIAGQTVMLIREPGKAALVVHGTTWSPRKLPAGIESEQLRYGRTASTVPSTLAVLDVAWRRFGSGAIEWPELVRPAVDIAEDGFVVGPFRHRSFRAYADDLRRQTEAAQIYLGEDGRIPQVGDRIRQPLLAQTLSRIARDGAKTFYTGTMAREIAADMAANGGWITLYDLTAFPEPAVVPALRTEYRGYAIETLPPPFGGWVALQALELLETVPARTLATDDDARRLALVDALRAAHTTRQSAPVTDYVDYGDAVRERLSPDTIRELADSLQGGETTHFTVADATGTVVAVTQSIDSYFGAKVVHPSLGFLYNNYMQGFQLDDPAAPYYIEARQMPLSSMSATPPGACTRSPAAGRGWKGPTWARSCSAASQNAA